MKKLFLILLLAVSINAQTAPQYVLEFDGTKTQHVDHGPFWEVYNSATGDGVLADDFAWEMWVKIDAAMSHGHGISAGQGGGHSILFGVQKDGGTGLYYMTGNFTYMPTGACLGYTQWLQFSSAPILQSGVWYHLAVASENHVLRLYKNGTVVYTQGWAGKRISGTCFDDDWSSGSLYVGGSDHLTWTGRIGAVRGWEGYSPYGVNTFTPEEIFRSDWGHGYGLITDSVFLADYTVPALMPADLSNGYKGKKHPGHLKSAIYGLVRGLPTRTGFPLPKYVEDPTYPAFQ